MGGLTDDAPAGVAILGSYPVGLSGTPQGIWKADAIELADVADDWRVEVRVVCADAADE